MYLHPENKTTEKEFIRIMNDQTKMMEIFRISHKNTEKHVEPARQLIEEIEDRLVETEKQTMRIKEQLVVIKELF